MTILNLNSDILTSPSLTLNTFGTMQPVIKAILFKKCSQQLLYGFPYEATIARVQEFSSRRVDSTDTPSAIKILFFCPTYFIEVNWFISKKILIFHGSRGSPSILPGVRMVSNFFQGEGVSRCLIIPYLSPYYLCFSRGSGLPSGSEIAMFGLSGCCDKS